MSVISIDPMEVFKIIKSDQNSVIVDVRTVEEFNFAGYIDLSQLKDSGNQLLMLPLKLYPEMNYNQKFQETLEGFLKNYFSSPSEVKIFFICKTGGRSKEAATYFSNLGYKNCYNINNGFEGDLNEQNQRGKINGWKASNLPWRQQ